MNKVVDPKIETKITQNADLQNADDVSPRMTSKVAAARLATKPNKARNGRRSNWRPVEKEMIRTPENEKSAVRSTTDRICGIARRIASSRYPTGAEKKRLLAV